MPEDQHPSVRSLVVSCLFGCGIIVMGGIGLSYFSSGDSTQTQASSSPELASAVIPKLPTLPTLTELADAFSPQINGVQSAVESFDVTQFTTNITEVEKALTQFDRWASFVGEGTGLSLSHKSSQKLKTLYDNAKKVQKASLPKLRDSYGPVARAEFAEQNIAMSAMTIGKGYRTLIFTGAEFKNKQAVEEFHSARHETLIGLRFEKVIYRSRKGDRNPTVKKFESKSDDLLIAWTKHKNLGVTGMEHVFSAINHDQTPKTTIADAEVVQ